MILAILKKTIAKARLLRPLLPLFLLYGFTTFFLAFLLVYQNRQATQADVLVAHTQQVLQVSGRLQTLSQQELATFRGYLLLQDPRMEAEHRQVQKALQTSLQHLGKISRNKYIQQDVATLQNLVNQRIAFTQDVRSAFQGGALSLALSRIEHPAYKKNLEDLYRLTNRINQREIQLYQLSIQKARQSSRVLHGLLWVALALLFAASIDLVRRTVRYRQLQQKVAHDQQQFDLLLNSLQSGLLVMDLKGVVREWNEKAAALCGYTKEELLGKVAAEMMQVQYQNKTMEDTMTELLHTGVSQVVAELQHKDGRPIYHVSIISLRRDSHGQPDGMTVMFQDISSFMAEKDQLAQAVKTLSRNLSAESRKYEMLVRSISDSIYSVDADWNILYLNDVACNINKVTSKAATGTNLWHLWSWINLDQYESLVHTLQGCLTEQRPGYEEVDFKEVGAFYTMNCYPQAGGLNIIFKDITATRTIQKQNLQLQDQLLAKQRQYATLVQSVVDGIYVLDRNWRFTYANPVFCGYFGVTEETLLGVDFRDFWLPLRTEPFASLYQMLEDGLLRGKDGYQEVLGEDGVHSYGIRVYPLENGISVLYRDVSEKWNFEKERDQMTREISTLNRHLQQVREDERLELAREIHDELGQQLSGIKISLALLLRKAQRHTDLLKQDAAECLVQMDESIQTVRRISTDLRPPMLDDLGMLQAMEWHGRNFEKRTGIRLTLRASSIPSIPASRSIHLFRIFQESLTNIARHAKANEVSVNIDCKPELLELKITDNGRGLPPQRRAGALGILGMQERALVIGGSFHIENNPRGGTTVSVHIPPGTNIIHA